MNSEPIKCPFVVLIDTAESAPWSFTGLHSDADKQHRPLIVETEWRCLRRFPDSLGDYSLTSLLIDGYNRCHVERKSMEDAQATILGFGDGRRQRFEQELANLNELENAAVVVECDFPSLIQCAPAFGKRTAQQNAKSIHRSVIAFQQDFPRVQWLFCGSRRFAEMTCFRFLERWYRKQAEAMKAAAKEAKRAELRQQAELELASL